ncbi:MAG: class I SAM-dependent methyltransferase [Caulobacteraceae bacterium]|nr:class I SAM-dependent methyltransferase [Caulobacteraceae bacterium]
MADVYDAGRPRFGAAIIGPLMADAGLAPGDPVLEVGGGTGQLTAGLVAAGLHVLSLEPGPRMATMLQQSLSDRARVVCSTFEDFTPEQTYRAVLSANAFHWVDPAISYRKAAGALGPGGHIGLIWNFPILRDARLQERLNQEAFTGGLQGFARNPVGYPDQLERQMALGRAELSESGAFQEPRWRMEPKTFVLGRAAYIDLLNSYANGADVRSEITSAVCAVVGPRDHLELVNYVYVCVAQSGASGANS